MPISRASSTSSSPVNPTSQSLPLPSASSSRSQDSTTPHPSTSPSLKPSFVKQNGSGPTTATTSPSTASLVGLPPARKGSADKKREGSSSGGGGGADTSLLYESVQKRIQALEEVEQGEEEEEKKASVEARKSVKESTDYANLEVKYIELFQELRRQERVHVQERGKLTKDNSVAKTALSKATSARNKLEQLARELQKENKKLREETKKLAGLVEEARDEIESIKQEVKAVRSRPGRAFPLTSGSGPGTGDLILKVVCKGRAELYFKVSRSKPLSRLFLAWSTRMTPMVSSSPNPSPNPTSIPAPSSSSSKATNNKSRSTPNASSSTSTVPTTGLSSSHPPPTVPLPPTPASSSSSSSQTQALTPSFIFTHAGKVVESDQTPDELGMDEADELIAIELCDLTGIEEEGKEVFRRKERDDKGEEVPEGRRRYQAAEDGVQEVFHRVIREKLKIVLRQYEVREQQYEAVLKSKELEILLAKARSEESKHQVDEARAQTRDCQTQSERYGKAMDEMQKAQNKLLEKLVTLASSPSATDRTTSLFAFIREHQKEREEEERQQQGSPTATGSSGGGVKVDGIVAEG